MKPNIPICIIIVIVIIVSICVSSFGQELPPLVGCVDFNDTSVGMIIDSNRYISQGILLHCSEGQYLYTVERDGPQGTYGRCLTVSGGGYIDVVFVVPGTDIQGIVQRTDIQVLDSDRHGYNYYYYDKYDCYANYGSNYGDYNIGDGWFYTDGPVAHTFKLEMNSNDIYLDNIKYSKIYPVPEPSTFALLSIGAIGLLAYAWRWRK
jgi:hypothetical protein